jgi:hypothetical protein
VKAELIAIAMTKLAGAVRDYANAVDIRTKTLQILQQYGDKAISRVTNSR